MPGRRRLLGVEAVARALARGEALQQVVVPEEGAGPGVPGLIELAERAGVPVVRVSARQFARLAPAGSAHALGVAGAPPAASVEEVLRRGGAAWLLTGTAYPGNAGFAIRTAEGSGADGVFVDADFDHAGRREALRVSMRADRFMPVFWDRADRVLAAATRAGRRLVAAEDTGDRPPWAVDLRGPVLFVVGHEREGVAAGILERCDDVVRVPMAGFLRSYNLHATVAALAYERLRQLEGTA